MRTELTITSKTQELTTLQIALTDYLDQFNIETILEAPATSSINNAVRMYNRFNNLASGCDVEYDVNRLPGCLIHKASFAQSHMQCGGNK